MRLSDQDLRARDLHDPTPNFAVIILKFHRNRARGVISTPVP
jgi:hypothetical protein